MGWPSPTDEDLAEFGRGYLDEILDAEAAVATASEHASWDMEAQKMVDYIRERAAAVGNSP